MAKFYLPFLQKYATLYTKHYFKSGMAFRGTYLSNISFFIRSGKFMLLFYPLSSIRAGVSACNTQAVILLQTEKGGVLWQETGNIKVMCSAC